MQRNKAMNILDRWSPHCRLAFGGASLSGEQGGYGFGSIELREAHNLLACALDLGMRVFDSAPIYGFGESERVLGDFFGQREDIAIISKSGVGWHDNKRVNMSNDPKLTQAMLEDSLRRLQRDRIEIYMIHWPDAQVDIRRPMEVLARAQAQGKILHIGLCNSNAQDWQLAQEVAPVEVLQSQVNFFERPPADLMQMAAQAGVPMMGWGTFDKGIIAGSVTPKRQFEKSDARSWAPWWKNSDKDRKMAVMEKLLVHLRQHGHSGIEFGLKCSLDHCAMPLIGAKSVNQLKQVVAASRHLPSDELMQELQIISQQSLQEIENSSSGQRR